MNKESEERLFNKVDEIHKVATTTQVWIAGAEERIKNNKEASAENKVALEKYKKTVRGLAVGVVTTVIGFIASILASLFGK